MNEQRDDDPIGGFDTKVLWPESQTDSVSHYHNFDFEYDSYPLEDVPMSAHGGTDLAQSALDAMPGLRVSPRPDVARQTSLPEGYIFNPRLCGRN